MSERWPLLGDARSATSQLEGRVYLTRSPQESKNLYPLDYPQRQATLPDYRDMNLAREPCGLLRPNRETTGSVDELIRATGARHLGGCYVTVAGGKASTGPGAEGRVCGMWKSGPTDANRAKELT